MNKSLSKKFDEEFTFTIHSERDGIGCMSGQDNTKKDIKSFIDKHFVSKKERINYLLQSTNPKDIKINGQPVYTKSELLDLVGEDKDVSDTNRVYIQNDYGYNQALQEIRDKIKNL